MTKENYERQYKTCIYNIHNPKFWEFEWVENPNSPNQSWDLNKQILLQKLWKDEHFYNE